MTSIKRKFSFQSEVEDEFLPMAASGTASGSAGSLQDDSFGSLHSPQDLCGDNEGKDNGIVKYDIKV